jgi:hypothetical protein
MSPAVLARRTSPVFGLVLSTVIWHLGLFVGNSKFLSKHQSRMKQTKCRWYTTPGGAEHSFRQQCAEQQTRNESDVIEIGIEANSAQIRLCFNG